MASSGGSNKKPPSAAAAAAAGSLIPSLLMSPPSSDPKSPILLLLPQPSWPLLRRLLLFFLSLLLRLFALFLSPLFPPPPTPPSSSSYPSSPSPATRALSHILSIISFIPISSRKYHFALSLADRLLGENLTCFPAGAFRAVNRAALSHAFEHTIRRLEAVLPGGGGGPMDAAVGAIWAGFRRLGLGEAEGAGGATAVAAEKLAAEALWLAHKLDDCGAAGEAAARWAAAAGLGRSALRVEPRVQVALVRLSVFLFRNAHSMQVESYLEDHDENDEIGISISQCCMSMLRTWLPLLCRASNGIDSPILNSSERAEMVRVLEEMIQKLNWEQQEEVLALWLHYFTSCPDSDWPNLESCYTRWYAQSRKLFLQ